jgi:hypothetical protein
MPMLVSCGDATPETSGDGGYLGNSLSLKGPIHYTGKGTFEAGVGDGTITFSQMSPSVDLVTTAVSSADFSQTQNAPGAGLTSLWATIMGGLPSFTVSDTSAKGFVINTIVFHRTSPSVDNLNIYKANYAFTTVVFYAYSDKDVTITASGTYNGPGGTSSDTCDMNFSLKTGWNRVILSRTGAGPYSDTWRIGEEPSGVYWAYGW